MDCRNARMLLEFNRPAELDPLEADALAAHLDDCPDCQLLQESERALDEPLESAMRDVPVPGDLRGRILARLAAERDAWYRRRLFRTGAMAASLLLALGLGLGWWWSQRVPVDLALLAAPLPANEAEVSAWFQARGIQTPLPARFNYALVVHVGFSDVSGQRVPEIVLESAGRRRARIFILDAARFDLASLRDPPSGQGACALEIQYDDPAAPTHAFLICYTGDSLEPFKVSGGSRITACLPQSHALRESAS